MRFKQHIIIFSFLMQFFKIVVIVCILFFSSCKINNHLKPNEFLVVKTGVKTNHTNINKEELEAFIRQKPNRKILKLARFNLWLYNQVDQKKLILKRDERNAKYDRINTRRIEKNQQKNLKRERKGKRLKQPRLKNKEKPTFRESLLEAGEAPVILDSSLTHITKTQLQGFVFSRGYFNSKVKDSLVVIKKDKRAKVFYHISKSNPYYIKHIRYNIEDPLIEYFIFNDTLTSLIKCGDQYNEDVFQAERERITEAQLNNGYYYFAPEYINYSADTNLIGNFVYITINVKKYYQSYSQTNDSLVFKNHPRFYIENIYVIPENIANYKGSALNSYCKDTTLYNGIKILHNKELLFRKKDLMRNIYLSQGQLYQQQLAEETFKELNALKVFKNVSIQYLQNPNFADKLDCYIVCQPVVKQALTAETEGSNTSGNLGLAGSLVFQNKNTFKGAEILELKLKGSLSAQGQFNESKSTDLANVQKTFNTFQFGPELNLYIPKPLFPFTLFYYKKDAFEKRFFFQPKTILNLSVNYQSRQQFSRTISNISYGFKFSNYKNLFTYDVIPFETYLVKAKLSSSFANDLIDNNDFFLINSFQDHITTLSKITGVYNNKIIKNKRSNVYLKMSLSSSGNILRMVSKATNQPHDSLGRYLLFKTPFSQFIKLDADYRFYFKVRKESQVIVRVAGGIGKTLANLATLPYEQSFFGGGPNSNRAWRARTLGPGGYSQPEGSTSKFDKIGDFQLEGNIEYRFHIFKSFNGAWFTDVGNIWLLNKDDTKPLGHFETDRFFKEIAIGSGFGLRYDFSFFILRLDAGLKIYDPSYTELARWQLNKNILNTRVIHFGIGYPF